MNEMYYDRKEQLQKIESGLLPGEVVEGVFDMKGGGTGFIGITNKRVIVALTYIHGIGRTKAQQITRKLGIGPERRVQDLTDQEVLQIRETIDQNHMVEGDLRRDVAMNIKRLMDLACYRGLRHRKGLPVRGQRTHTNARTRKGKAKPIAGKKK